MRISHFESHRDNSPTPQERSWAALAVLLDSTQGRQDKEGPCWSPAYYAEGAARGKKNVEGVSLLVLDLDHISAEGVVTIESNLKPLEYMAHESFSSTPDDYCLRFVLRLSRDVLPSEWPRFWPAAITHLAVPADPATSDASRLYFLPARPPGCDYRLEVNKGEALNVDAIMADAPEVAHTESRVSVGVSEENPIPEGRRESTLHALAAHMRRFGFSRDETLAAVHLRNLNACKPPLSDAEVAHTVESAQRYDIESDVQGNQGFKDFLDARKPTGPKETDDYIVDLADFYDRHDANADDADKWLIQGILGKGVPQIMGGPPKAHKSWVMYDQALALATGEPWLGQFDTTQTKALIISREDDEAEAHRRIVRLAVARGVDVRDLRDKLSINAIDPFTFSHEDYVDALRKGIERWEPGIIYMDSLSRVHGCDESSSQDMAQMIETWGGLCQEYGCSIVMIHHFNKASADGGGSILNRMRGSSALGAAVRHAIGVTKLEVDDPSFQGGISQLEFEGNLPGTASSFSIGVRDGVVGLDKAVYIEYRGNARDELVGQISRDIRRFLVASQPDPQTKANCLASAKGSITAKITAFRDMLESGDIIEVEGKYAAGRLDTGVIK